MSFQKSILTGRYIGDGTGNRTIPTNVLSQRLKAVLIFSSPAAGRGQGVFFTSDAMSPGDWRDVNGDISIGLRISGVNFIVSTGTGDGPNQDGYAYDWIAFR